MITLDEATLIAYVDGELDSQTAREVESKIAADADVRRHVEHLRALAALTRIAFNDTLHEAVPQALKDAALGRTADASSHHAGSATVVPFSPRPQVGVLRRMAPHSLAAAAAVFGLVLGLGGGVQYSEKSTSKSLQLAALSLQQDQGAMELALNKALEVNISGNALTWTNPDSGRSAAFTPVRTYQDKAGKFCREYRKDVTSSSQTDTTFGLACRDENGAWKTRYLILEEGAGQNL